MKVRVPMDPYPGGERDIVSNSGQERRRAFLLTMIREKKGGKEGKRGVSNSLTPLTFGRGEKKRREKKKKRKTGTNLVAFQRGGGRGKISFICLFVEIGGKGEGKYFWCFFFFFFGFCWRKREGGGRNR